MIPSDYQRKAMKHLVLSLEKIELQAVLSAYFDNMTVEDFAYLSYLINTRHHLVHDLQDAQEVVE